MIRLKTLIAPSLGLLLSLPVVFLLLYSISSGLSFEELKKLNILEYASTTALLVAGTAILIFIFGGLSAYLVARFDFFGRSFFSYALILPLAFPSFIMGYAYNGIFEHSGLLSQISGKALHVDILNIYGCIAIFALSMYPYLFIVAKSAFANLSSSLEEVARLKGVSGAHSFWRIYLPLVYPAFFIGILLASLEVISDYGTVIYFGVESFSVGVFKQWFGYGDMEGAINISLALVGFVLLFLYFESILKKRARYASATLSSKKLERVRLGGFKGLGASLFCALLALFAFFLPLFVLIYWAYLDWSSLDMELFGKFMNTASLNVLSAFFIASAAFLVLYLRREKGGFFKEMIHKISLLGYSIPGAVVGIGLLLFFGLLDKTLGMYFFGGSFFILFFGYAVRFYPAAIGALNSGFGRITKELDEASVLYSEKERVRMFGIYLPMLRGSFLSAFLILFIDISKELPITLLLRPFNFDTLAVRVYELSSNEMLASTALPSLALLLMTLGATMLLNRRSI